MHQPIGDKATILFAEEFYNALGAGRPYEEAYRIGCNAIALEGISEHQIPVLKNRNVVAMNNRNLTDTQFTIAMLQLAEMWWKAPLLQAIAT
jgi:hypothetical protein